MDFTAHTSLSRPLTQQSNEATEVKIDQDNRSNETQASKKLGQEGHRK
jgi:hypothetical protein